MEILFNYFEIFLAIFVIAVGYFWGSYVERRHYSSIIEREQLFSDVIAISSKRPPENAKVIDVCLGNVVIASDPFKRFVAWLIGIFGGNINVYESLLDRARREAILRLKDEVIDLGGNMVVNLKLETSNINYSSKNQAAAMVEVLAYGTCVLYKAK